jgi:class 3 adenylate cyclase
MASVALNKSVGISHIYLIVSYLTCLPAWLGRPSEFPYILSAAIVGAVVVAVLRSRLTAEVEAFINEQEKLETQLELIETQQELTDQVRSFLPREIYRRIIDLVQRERKTVLQAMDEVLHARMAYVTCLYSDIRGFTGKSRDIYGFVSHAALPSNRVAIDIVEDHRGIPRLIGDLVFAYFDGPDPAQSFRNAILAAFEILDKNAALNSTLPESGKVSRYVILSFGEALVGNSGGSDGSREITVLGTPANIVNRIDSLTKDDRLHSLLNAHTVVLRARNKMIS